MIVLGGLEVLSGAPEGLWLALIGFFVVTAAGQQAMGAQVQAALSGVHASDLMSSPVMSIDVMIKEAKSRMKALPAARAAPCCHSERKLDDFRRAPGRDYSGHSCLTPEGASVEARAAIRSLPHVIDRPTRYLHSHDRRGRSDR
jgi:hypothetical protein